MVTVAVLGGYGNFGAIICRQLVADSQMTVLVAGRDLGKAQALASTLGAKAVVLDGSDPQLARALRAAGVDIVLNCAGPFQGAGYEVARAAIAARAHYVDIADGRRFVCDIVELHDAAAAARVAVISGASSVPALSSAVVDAHLDRFAKLSTIQTGISASEKIPGVATVTAVLSYAGRRIDVTRGGGPGRVFGWQGLHRERFAGPVNNRYLCFCDVPDLELFPLHYPSLQCVSFSAGLGLTVTHLGTWILAGLTRSGLLRRPERLAPTLRRAGIALERFGSGTSAMYVRMTGTDRHGAEIAWRWELIARNNDGAQVPCLAAVALCRKLANGESIAPGARACVGILSLDEYLAELDELPITTSSAPD